MVSRGSSGAELPPGWREHVKVTNGRKTKFYTHLMTGLRLYSKKRVWSFDQMALEETLRPLVEQDQKSITSKNEDEVMACQGTLHPLSEQNQKRITTRSQDKAQAFQGTLQSSSEQQEMIRTPKSEVGTVVVETDASMDWLPLGWIVESKVRKFGSSAGTSYKIYVDPSTGCKFNSKPKVIKYLERVNGKSLPEKQNVKQEVTADISYKQEGPQIIPIEGKTATCVKDSQAGRKSSVVSRSTRLDELPPGWVKELRARKGDPNKKDPYYIDPDSGYEFRSKKDVLRYLETGDMSRCAMKPQPRRHVEKSDHSVPTPTRTACNAVDDVKQLEAEKSKLTETGCILAEPKLEFAYFDDKMLHSEEGSETTKKGATPRTRTRSQLLHEQKHQEDLLDAKTQIELKKSLKRKLLSMPARSSKRLSRVEPEVLPVSSESAIRAAVKRAIQGQARVASSMENGFPHQLGTTNQPKGHLTDPQISCKVASPSSVEENGFPHQLGTYAHQTKLLNDHPVSCKVSSPSKEDEVQERLDQEARKVQEVLEIPKQAAQKVEEVLEIPEQAAGKVEEVQEKPDQAAAQVHNVREVENSWYPFGDSLADPCYEFAFKTLTGVIPFEDTLAFQGLSWQPAEAPSTQSVVSMGLPAIGTPALFQNDIPFLLDSVSNIAPTYQPPNNSTLQPSGRNRASFTGFNQQQPSLETSKDQETRAHS